MTEKVGVPVGGAGGEAGGEGEGQASVGRGAELVLYSRVWSGEERPRPSCFYCVAEI